MMVGSRGTKHGNKHCALLTRLGLWLVVIVTSMVTRMVTSMLNCSVGIVETDINTELVCLKLLKDT